VCGEFSCTRPRVLVLVLLVVGYTTSSTRRLLLVVLVLEVSTSSTSRYWLLASLSQLPHNFKYST